MKDSRPDTYEHIHNVRSFLQAAVDSLQDRQILHDRSKLFSPEIEAYNEMEDRLRQHNYDTEGYWQVLREMDPAIQHHYANNPHHPEAHEGGIRGMSLLDLVEMLCDWKAAAMRRPERMRLSESIEVNQKRFGYSDELKQILLNTARELGDKPWREPEEVGDPLPGLGG